MKIAGIICEYNPFHTGHEYHIRKTKELTGADYIICAMSGCFTQRGEPAMFDKYSRARCALAGGADLVIELPVLTSIMSAKEFAYGGVELLSKCKIDYLSFGSENDDMNLLTGVADLIHAEPKEYMQMLKQELNLGKSFPAARATAVKQILNTEILNKPNAILAVEYLCALKDFKNITPVAVKRLGAGYNETKLSKEYSSATAIRQEILKNGLSDKLIKHIPSVEVYKNDIENGFIPVALSSFDQLITYKLRESLEYLESLYDVNEGLHNRIFNCAREYSSVNEIISAVKTKRYTHTKISRIMLYALLGLTKELKGICKTDYARVLGITSEAKELLNIIGKNIDIITTPNAEGNISLELDLIADSIYSLAQKNPPWNSIKSQYTRKLLVV